MERRGAFDYILLETSGLADPGNIAPLFWVDDGLGSTIYLDGIVTLVDAKNIILSLEETPKEGSLLVSEEHHGPQVTIAHLQISHADVIVLNKGDTISAEDLQIVKDRVQGINSLATVHVTEYSRIPKLEGLVLDLHAYDGIGSLETSEKGHSHHDESISTLSIPVPVLTDTKLLMLDVWLRELLWECNLSLPSGLTIPISTPKPLIHRLKGRIRLDSGAVKMVQGVREVFEITDLDRGLDKGPKDTPETTKDDRGKLVLIGKGLAGLPWEASLRFSLGFSEQ
ncbi:MAG: hypothetical protein Q9187_002193 [Circinaria calcarea]